MIHLSTIEKTNWDGGNITHEIKLDFPDLNLTLTNDMIYGESMELKEGIFDGNDALQAVGCMSSCFTVEIRHPELSPDNSLYPSNDLFPGAQEGTLQGAKIFAYIGLTADSITWHPIFHGYVDSVETTRERSYQKLTCYDALYYLGSKNVIDVYNSMDTQFTLADLRDALFAELGITQLNDWALPLDTHLFERSMEAEELAAIDLIKYICQINGVFGIINRDGLFEYRKLSYYYDLLPYPSDETFPSDDLYPGVVNYDNHDYIDAYKSIKYEDYETYPINTVVVRDSENDENAGSWGIVAEGELENCMVVEGNPLVVGATTYVKKLCAEAILDSLSEAIYTPYTAVSPGRWYIEPGDSISFYVYDYSTGVQETVIMNFIVLNRTLKGIQWLEDTFSATGVQFFDEATCGSDISAMQSEINNIRTDMANMETTQGVHKYAETEHVVGTWINDNDVYEKTVRLNSLPSNTSQQYPHNIGGFGLILYANGMKHENNAYVDLLCDNEVKVDATNIVLTSNKAQSGTGYITVGYIKPQGGYYPNSPYYAKDAGTICTGWYMKGIKTASGECYSGMVVGRAVNINSLRWAAFCISLEAATAMAMQYQYGPPSQLHTFEYNGQTWYYTYDATGSAATSTDLDGTNPASRRYYIGDYTAQGSTFEDLNTEFIELAIPMLMDYIYT